MQIVYEIEMYKVIPIIIILFDKKVNINNGNVFTYIIHTSVYSLLYDHYYIDQSIHCMAAMDISYGIQTGMINNKLW